MNTDDILYSPVNEKPSTLNLIKTTIVDFLKPDDGEPRFMCVNDSIVVYHREEGKTYHFLLTKVEQE